MSGIKYYQLADGEELPDEFCAIRNTGGEPTEYTFYRQEAENAKLRELCADMWALSNMRCRDCDRWVQLSVNVGTCRDHCCVRRREIEDRMRSLEVPT